MAGFDELGSRPQVLRQRTALFRRVVLHAHSLASFDWRGKRGDATGEEDAFLGALRESGLDLIALTDHFKCSRACSLSRKMWRPRVLPGVEVALCPPPPLGDHRLHLLAIFQENYEVEQIWQVMPPGFASEREARGKEEITGVDIAQFVDGVHKCGGLCLAAHVDSPQGVRFVFRQTAESAVVLCDADGRVPDERQKAISQRFKEWLLTAGLDGIEVARCEDKVHYRVVGEAGPARSGIAVLLTNDAHSEDDLLRSARWTSIKMTAVGFEGLRQALRFPDTRIRFPEEVPRTPCPRVLGLQIQGPPGSAFFSVLARGRKGADGRQQSQGAVPPGDLKAGRVLGSV